jgi:hypothetical protein
MKTRTPLTEKEVRGLSSYVDRAFRGTVIATAVIV